MITPESPPLDGQLHTTDLQVEALRADLDALDPQIPVAVDTEADSFHHYYEKVCLLQIGVPGRSFLLDPLASDPRPVLGVLAGRTLLLHGADYDLRLLSRGYGFRAVSLFDTLIAAQLLGEPELGLAALVRKRCAVEMDKSLQRADWSVRPLTPALMSYALEDVRHMHALAQSLTADLVARGRLAWHAEECARLAASPFLQRERNGEDEWRIKGSNALTDRERAFLRAFWAARERRARSRDVPPFRVLPSEALLRAARLAAAGQSSLPALFPSPRNFPASLAADLSHALAEAADLPQAAWPGRLRGERQIADPALEREVNRLRSRRDGLARQLEIEPGILASRQLLADAARVLLRSGPVPPGTMAREAGMSLWRAELLFSA